MAARPKTRREIGLEKKLAEAQELVKKYSVENLRLSADKVYYKDQARGMGTLIERRRQLQTRVFEKQETIRELRGERRRLLRKIEGFENPKLSDVQVSLIEIAEEVVPAELMGPTKEIITDRLMSETLESLMERRDEIGSSLEMLLIGIGMNREAKRHFDTHLDDYWRADKRDPVLSTTQEVIVGAGVHGAITAAVRHRKTGLKPLVLDSGRAGGAFAVSRGPSFFLNSRNRPGRLSIPGDVFGALNVLPGAPIQPSQVSGDEYLANDTLAWVVRATLMMHAEVASGLSVTNVERRSKTSNAFYASPFNPPFVSMICGKIFVAAGLTGPKRAFQMESPRYLNFEEFMRRMDDPYPLRGMDQVAVLGAGDGGKTVVEALVGQGPTTGLSIPTLDYPKIIDWFGVPVDQRDRDGWESCNRSRYKGIGRVLGGRVVGFDAPRYLDAGYDSLKVNGKTYDYVIDCTGYTMEGRLSIPQDSYYLDESGQMLGASNSEQSIFYVGPGSQLPSSRTDEEVLSGIGENATSIFRYADRTARLAEIV